MVVKSARLAGRSVGAWRYRPAMAVDHLAGPDGTARPRVIVSVTATADGRVTLSRMERLLDDGAHGTIWAHYEVVANPSGGDIA